MHGPPLCQSFAQRKGTGCAGDCLSAAVAEKLDLRIHIDLAEADVGERRHRQMDRPVLKGYRELWQLQRSKRPDASARHGSSAPQPV